MERSTRARRTDPSTSHEAAARLTPDKLTAAQSRVLAMFRLYGDMPDTQLVKYLNAAEKDAGVKPMSPSGVRSRRSELSKPNMDRINALIEEQQGDAFYSQASPETQAANARHRLKTEGFRSPLWDTGKRMKIDGSNVIVWGLAV